MIRERHLPAGWYPQTADEVRDQCAAWSDEGPLPEREHLAVVVPHAGWLFSGSLAYRTMRGLRRDVDIVVVVGGHLHPEDSVMIAPEDAVATPFGSLPIDDELREFIRSHVDWAPDHAVDNTVEIQLPLLAEIFGSIPVVYLRCPPSGTADTLGRVVAEYARMNSRAIAVVGSTDLTHYGMSYGFSPHGAGDAAVRWVKEVNDARFIEALLKGDPETIVRRAVAERSACSAGAAAAAAAFARASGPVEADVIGYYPSFDVMPNTSFVGYVGVGYRPKT